jgi:hypothetical protein
MIAKNEPEIFIRALKKSDPAHRTMVLSQFPDKQGYYKCFKPYGSQGRGYYYILEIIK